MFNILVMAKNARNRLGGVLIACLYPGPNSAYAQREYVYSFSSFFFCSFSTLLGPALWFDEKFLWFSCQFFSLLIFCCSSHVLWQYIHQGKRTSRVGWVSSWRGYLRQLFFSAPLVVGYLIISFVLLILILSLFATALNWLIKGTAKRKSILFEISKFVCC